MSNRWHEIWAGKQFDNMDKERDEYLIFCDLKKADGFDVEVDDEEKYFRSFYNSFLRMYEKIKEYLGKEISSIYEVGCGSGVNLWMFSRRLSSDVMIGGMDYSGELLKCAENMLSNADLTCGEAINIPVIPQYDVVMSDSVFQYFVSEDYAYEVLRRMIKKAKSLVFLGEIHDKNKEKEWLAMRRASMENYDKIYEGLPKLFLDKKVIESIADEFGKSVEYEEIDNPEYWNSKYVFNAYIF